MVKKAQRKNNSMLIGGICLALVVVAIVVVAIVMMNKSKLNDSYFVSDGSKYVFTMETTGERDETMPVKTHVVYTYTDDTITGMKTYAEYANAGEAKKAYDLYVSSEGTPVEMSRYSLDGKYVILDADKSEYEDLKASDVKQQIEFMEMLKNLDDGTTNDAATEEGSAEVIDGGEAVVEESQEETSN